jgi:cell fate (sporulation/competence/biofilm development) regulator YlbF (YheA/YmcA/DUF963 family)
LMSLVLERARQLAKAFESCDEYVAYQKALQELKEHEAARLMYEDFQRRQAEIQSARLSGEDVSEDRIKELEQRYEIIMMNPYVRDAVIAEFRFTQLFAEAQKIIGEAVGLRYSESDDADGDSRETSGSKGASDGIVSGETVGGEAGQVGDSDDELKGPRRIIVPGRDF